MKLRSGVKVGKRQKKGDDKSKLNEKSKNVKGKKVEMEHKQSPMLYQNELNQRIKKKQIKVEPKEIVKNVKEAKIEKNVNPPYSKHQLKTNVKTVKKRFTKGKTTKLLNKRQYEEQKWKEREVAKGKHFSHVDITFEGNMISEQKIPGFCLLCTNQFLTIKPSIMKYHFNCVQ